MPNRSKVNDPRYWNKWDQTGAIKSGLVVTPEYKCAVCGATGCKLWYCYSERGYKKIAHCCECASKYGNLEITEVDDVGSSILVTRFRGFASHYPAIPRNGSVDWIVRAADWTWWESLPTRPVRRATA